MSVNTSKRGWTAEEDQIIHQLISASHQDKHKWINISKQLFERTGRQRTGKQCRERWQHQLNPVIVRDQWTQQQVTTLFKMHLKYGNKWAKIAANLPGRTDNAVKNFFYSSARRVLTKINVYLVKQRHRKQFKTIRQFQSEYLSKLISVVDGHFEKRLRLTGPQAFNLAKGMFQLTLDILTQIAYLIIHGIDQNMEGIDQQLDEKILKMHQFRKNCKKRKKIHNFYGQEDEEEQSIEAISSPKDSLLQSSQSYSSQKSKDKQEISHSISQGQRQIEFMDFESENIEKKEVVYSKEQIWNLYGSEYNFKQNYLKIQQSHCEQKFKEQSDIFSMPFGYRQEQQNANRIAGQPEVITKFKMLEVSIALDECLLKANQPQDFEGIQKLEPDL